MMAAVCCGLYPDMASCADAWITPALGPMTQPDPGLAGLYDKLYAEYRAIREAMPPVWRRLAAIRQERQA